MIEPDQIGKVHFTWQGEEAEAILGRDGVWTSPDEVITDCLNAEFNLRGWSQADGFPGRRQLDEAAAWLDGRVEVGAIPPDAPDVAF